MNSWADYYRSAVADEYIPPQNRLFPPERPVIDYNVIADSEPFTSSAIRGGSYSSAALAGGKKLRKGSAEAKRHMAYLRSLRSGGKRGGKYPGLPGYGINGSKLPIYGIIGSKLPEAQRRMREQIERHHQEWVRRQRLMPGGKYRTAELGSGVIGDLFELAGKNVAARVGDMVNRTRELKYLQELKKQKGGDWKSDLKYFFTTPGGPLVAAISLGIKKAQEKKIEKLKKELGMS